MQRIESPNVHFGINNLPNSWDKFDPKDFRLIGKSLFEKKIRQMRQNGIEIDPDKPFFVDALVQK